MRILQDTQSIIWDIETKIAVDQIRPDRGKIFYAQAAVHQPGFDLGAKDDVQIVSKFVGFDPDEAWTSRIDRAPELSDRHVSKLVGELRSQCSKIQFPEASRASDTIFQQPRLGLMH